MAAQQTMEEHKQVIQMLNKEACRQGVPDIDLLSKYYSEANYLLQDYPGEKHAFELTKFVKAQAAKQCQYVGDPMYQLYLDCLRFEAPFLFESYLLYMEKDRPYEKRFYEPRKKTLSVVVQDLQDLEDRKYDFYGLSLPARVGKLISDDTPVLTESGWKKHGDLKVGDYVYDFDGLLTKVIYVHPKQYANKRVWFTDHTYIDCHENHEWIVYDRVAQKEVVLETNYIEKHCKDNDRNRFMVPLKKSLIASEKDLPIDPYVLGAWLGDGTNTKPCLTICDTDMCICDSVEAAGYECTTKHKQVGCTVYSYSGLRSDLQREDMCYSRRKCQKHIPDIYFTASERQRLELLAGLLDTDGTLRRADHRYDYSTIDERLRDDVVSLVSSFGWRVCVTKHAATTSSSGIVGRHDVYTISFNPTMYIPCRVDRKQLKEFSKQRRIAIEKVEDIEPVSGNCITVAGGLYRVGRRMVPTHNSTICIFFMSWIMGRRPNSHNAMGGHSGMLAKGFYGELLNIIDTPEYNYRDIFPELIRNNRIIQKTSAEEYTINLGKRDRFSTFTARGADGTWTGAIDISRDGYLYVDDLVRDREHSLSPQRMENTYQEYLNKMVDRKNDGARELMVGTLWSVLDPLSRIAVEFADNPRYKFRSIPALNENDESNFDYEENGFSTQYYLDMRARLDNAEWMAKYMQKPYVREGLLFPSEELRYFNGIMPEGDYRTVAVIDVAWGGGDSLSMPIGREYENGDVYIFDWVFSTAPKEQTVPEVVSKIIDNDIRQVQCEGNVGGNMYSAYIDEELALKNFKCNVTEKKAPNRMSKNEKIMAYSGDIKRKFLFLAPNNKMAGEVPDGVTRYKRSSEYQKAMDEMCMYVTVGKNPHDDAVDGLTQLAMFIEGASVAKVQVFSRGRLGF